MGTHDDTRRAARERGEEYGTHRPTVATVLTVHERQRMDAACDRAYRTRHHETVEEALADVRAQRAEVVVVSAARCDGPAVPRVAAMVREFPRVPALALVSSYEPRTLSSAFTLGRCGVRSLVDVVEPSGWRALHALVLESGPSDIARKAIALLADDLAGAPTDCRRFFEALFRAPARVTTVRQLTRAFGVRPSTLMSRFFRAELPTPKQYLAGARLVRAARLFENPGHSVTTVANGLEYSSPQSFGRHLRTTLGITAVEFRRRYDGDAMLSRFREELVLPHLPALRRFMPFGGPAGWSQGALS